MIIKPRIILLSGGFDPLHIGHVRMINAAAELGEVRIILNSDEWLTKKKGKPFMKYIERWEILYNLKNVHEIWSVEDEDGTVNETLKYFGGLNGREIYFGNGGDRTEGNIPEETICKELGIGLLYGLGGPKIQSSSELVRNAKVTEEEITEHLK